MSLLSSPQTFGEAFPIIATLRATVRIKKGGQLDGHPSVQVFSLANPPGEFIACSKPGCTGRGWRIADALREMVAKHQTTLETGGICDGKERMSRSNYRSCLTHFEADIEVSYK
jgi:hypothetical protein